MNHCPICNSPRKVSFEHVVLKRYKVNYFYCENCGLLQTEEPYWLEQAYSSAIAQADTGLLTRNIQISKKLTGLLSLYFGKQAKYLDIAGGYGTLTRLMRDIGLDFYWHDIYCKNLLASGFEKPQDVESFAAVTAFEVLEHLPDPISFIESAFKEANTSTMIFSTELFSGTPPQPDAWWYYQFPTGQHISFYQRRTLEFIAKKLSLNLYSYNSMHMLTNQNFSKLAFQVMNSRLGNILHKPFKLAYKSKTFADHQLLLADCHK
jgi:hypothetical protein